MGLSCRFKAAEPEDLELRAAEEEHKAAAHTEMAEKLRELARRKREDRA